ncbi:hypothetical protein EYF80_014632 [Liparis tanakae]|uniref:Uncharacterized protein n=1 Tax=Liparis tanakae TaxID=230148 RepID=A0A4Z2ICR8_9TELE|nr:hypothetical protein EYF80_014632 [Liparis tanakae]
MKQPMEWMTDSSQTDRCRQDIFCWRQLSEDEPNEKGEEACCQHAAATCKDRIGAVVISAKNPQTPRVRGPVAAPRTFKEQSRRIGLQRYKITKWKPVPSPQHPPCLCPGDVVEERAGGMESSMAM